MRGVAGIAGDRTGRCCFWHNADLHTCLQNSRQKPLNRHRAEGFEDFRRNRLEEKPQPPFLSLKGVTGLLREA
ncbi:hypothetical protein AOLI_G00006190 [Acnodon oligacanthus]